MSLIQVSTGFTRIGPQCGVCSGWQKPCLHCATGSSGVIITEQQMERSLGIVADLPTVEEMAQSVVRTGSIADRLSRASKALGLADCA